MKNTASLQKAVVEAAAEFTAAREKLVKAEVAFSQALHENACTLNAVDKNKPQKFSLSIPTMIPTMTDC